jgi:hypothetical protein
MGLQMKRVLETALTQTDTAPTFDQIGLKQKTEETQRAKKTKHFALPAAPAADEQNRHRSEQMPSPGKPKNRSSRRAGGTKQQAPGSSGPGSTRRTGLLTKIP